MQLPKFKIGQCLYHIHYDGRITSLEVAGISIDERGIVYRYKHSCGLANEGDVTDDFEEAIVRALEIVTKKYIAETARINAYKEQDFLPVQKIKVSTI